MIVVETYDPDRAVWVSVELYDVQEVADKLQVSTSTIYKLARTGLVHPYPAGRVAHFTAMDVAAFYAVLRGDLPPAPGGDGVSVDPALGTPLTDSELEGLR